MGRGGKLSRVAPLLGVGPANRSRSSAPVCRLVRPRTRSLRADGLNLDQPHRKPKTAKPSLQRHIASPPTLRIVPTLQMRHVAVRKPTPKIQVSLRQMQPMPTSNKAADEIGIPGQKSIGRNVRIGNLSQHSAITSDVFHGEGKNGQWLGWGRSAETQAVLPCRLVSGEFHRQAGGGCRTSARSPAAGARSERRARVTMAPGMVCAGPRACSGRVA